MRVRLTVKLANIVEGVDLSRYAEREVIELAGRDADLLIRGGWAERVTEARVRSTPAWRYAVAAERSSDAQRRPPTPRRTTRDHRTR